MCGATDVSKEEKGPTEGSDVDKGATEGSDVDKGATEGSDAYKNVCLFCCLISLVTSSVPREDAGTNRIDLCFDSGWGLYGFYFVFLFSWHAHTLQIYADSGFLTSLKRPSPATPISTSPLVSVWR